MQLPARLSASTLGDLLGLLHRSRTTGTLELWDAGGHRHRVHLACGLVAAIETAAPVAPIGEILAREGFLTPVGLRRLMGRLADGDPRRAGEILIAEGWLDPDVVDAALRAQLRERLEALFRLPDAAVRFHTARPPDASARRAGPLPPRDFLHGRPRRRDRPELDRATRERARTTATRPASASDRERGSHPGSSAANAPGVGSRTGAAPRATGPTTARASGPFAAREARREPASRAHDAPRSSNPPRAGEDERALALGALGLGRSAGPDEVRRAFRRLAVELHPDRCAGVAAEERARRAALFAQLSAAYHLLVA